MKADSDGFITVSHKGKRNRNCRKPTSQEISAHHQQAETKCSKFDKTILESVIKDLKNSNFLINFNEEVQCTLKTFYNNNYNAESNCQANLIQCVEGLTMNDNEIVDIVCYGLGHFTSCVMARYQLALLIILKDIVLPQNLIIYDPIFSDEEKNILEDLGWNVLDVNEEGKQHVVNKTIFFMPHCDLFLYNNLLWANWSKDNLSKIILIGNSFQQYLLDRTERYLKQKAVYVNYASKFVKETKIVNDFRYSDIFNNTSLHLFHMNALNEVPVEVWSYNIEPVYDGDDELIKNV